MKPYETENYKGYTINIHIDQTPENPFKAWDCEPPVATFYDGYTEYGNLLSPHELAAMLPAETWKPGKRWAFIRQHLNCSAREFAEWKRDNYEDEAGAFASLLIEQANCYSGKPSSWLEADSYFEVLELLCKLAGVSCYNGQSNGYCQGDSTLVFVMATPEWSKRVGAPPESLASQCKAAFDLYGAWAWGDVFGFTIEDEDGNELDDMGASVWGFYGSDHEKSGLMEAAREAIDSHITDLKNQQAELEAAFSFHA